MRNSRIIACAVGLMTVAAMQAAPVQAGFFDNLEKKVKKASEAAQEAERAVEAADKVRKGDLNSVLGSGGSSSSTNHPSYPKTAKSKGHAGRAGPPPAKYVSQTKCANLGLSNAMIGQVGDYTFSEGLSTEKRSGFINREPVRPTNGCIMPSMGTYDYLYVEVDTRKWEAMGNWNDWKMQCVQINGKPFKDQLIPHPDRLTGKDMMLHTGNSEGITPSFTGSNSDRSRAWDDLLKRRGKTMLSVSMPPLHNDSGTDFYCQYYNKPSGKSAFAFAYRRSAGS